MSTHHNANSNMSPFGTLDVPGNAALAYRHTHGGHGSNPSPFANAIPEDEEYSEDGKPSSHASRSLPRRATSSPRASPPFLGPPASALGRRVSVSAESIDPSSGPSAPLPFFQKTPEQMKRLQAAIANAFLFRNLDAKKRDAVLGAMKEMHFDRNERVITQGDDGDFFYVVDSGTLDCYVKANSPDSSLASGTEAHPTYGKKVTTYTKGGCFGELALMYFAKRAATIVTTSPCILWALDRLTFQTILLDISNRTRKSYEAFLRSVPILNSLTDQERAKLADVLQAREYNEGDTVVREGDIGTEFYIIEEGQAMVYKRVPTDDGEGKEELVLKLKKGDYFGELALLHRAPRAATVRAAVRNDPSKPPLKLKVAALDGDAFTRLLGPLRELMERSAELNYHSPR
jgi:cAMP-dependent protein kinase regulator